MSARRARLRPPPPLNHARGRLWRRGWRGPSVDLNGGSARNHGAPPHVSLALLCGANDYFWDRHPDPARATQSCVADFPGAVLHYYHPTDSHGAESYDDAIIPLLAMAMGAQPITSAAFTRTAQQATLFSKPAGQAAFIKV